MTAPSVGTKTRFLVFSDTHGLDSLPDSVSDEYADVAVHCGDLTTGSRLDEYRASIRFLQAVNAPLKLVIPGNHDFTMDTPAFQRTISEARPPLDPKLVDQVYGHYGEARRILDDATGITVLDEGTYSFRLQDGASLTVYASPYTPSLGDWGFQYHPDHGMVHRRAYSTILTLARGRVAHICLKLSHELGLGCIALVISMKDGVQNL
ncbi:hypothetical protein N7540_001557 [Penicillium herquei]|nr:hypothetical protein N7540_001557 [Penicillium herquei]